MNYGVDDQGGLYTKYIHGGKGIKSDCWNKKKTKISKDRYYVSDLKRDDGVVKTRKVHQLVLEAFVGLCPQGLVACHNNGDGFDNSLKNLRWDTLSSNNADTLKHGRVPIGQRCHSAKLKDSDIPLIRELLKNSTLPCKRIAKIFDVKVASIYSISSNRKWVHIT